MREFLSILTVLALMLPATAVLGLVESQAYRVQFDAVSYAGSDGSIFWDSPWKEIGESDGPSGSGIRQTAAGIQVDYSSGLFGSMEMDYPEVPSVELTADYQMAVEVIESLWVWMIGLLVVIAGAIVAGLDRRETLKMPPAVNLEG